MEFNKFQRILWTVNGILILAICLTAGVALLKEFFRDSDFTKPEIIVGEQLEEAKKQGLILQGLDYKEPFQVAGLKGFILPVSIKTFDTPISDKKYIRSPRFRVEESTFSNTVNIIFLDANYKVTGKLLDKKGFIASFTYPQLPSNRMRFVPEATDTTIHLMCYEIGFEDTNKDNVINNEDKLDLFISDVRGENLTKITSDIDVLEHKFLNNNEVFIQYYKRDEKSEEHKPKYFAKYLINEKKFMELTQLHETLDAIEKEMIQ